MYLILCKGKKVNIKKMMKTLHFSDIFAVLGAILIRWCISLNSYSGAGKPPMFGDYEAQRHWMEITYNLPVDEWYVNSTRNNLMYWGLDYPPLTAYHSWICGIVANCIDPQWVQLFTSRGFESYNHKLFMRYTVLVADVIVYMTAVFAFVTSYYSNIQGNKKGMLFGLILAYPGLNLIDHGHFQYNSISLGLTLWAVVFLLRRREVVGSIFFALALNYKQMELYHAFPFFFYLAGLCWKERTWPKLFFKLACIGFSVVMTFMICWLPFLGDMQLLTQVVHRIFPVARGLYEDKVANFWCSLSVFVKIKNILSLQGTLRLCLITTAAACIPTSLDLFFNPTIKKFLLSLVNCSLAFFLFSFQVHEKSILIAALPVCLLLPTMPLECFWFLLISTFSMYPLLERDGQALSYIVTIAIFALLSNLCFDLNEKKKKLLKVAIILSILGAGVIHVLALVFKPPPRLPDLFPVLFAVYSCGHFLLGLLFFNYVQIKDIKLSYVGSVDKEEFYKKSS